MGGHLCCCEVTGLMVGVMAHTWMSWDHPEQWDTLQTHASSAAVVLLLNFVELVCFVTEVWCNRMSFADSEDSKWDQTHRWRAQIRTPNVSSAAKDPHLAGCWTVCNEPRPWCSLWEYVSCVAVKCHDVSATRDREREGERPRPGARLYTSHALPSSPWPASRAAVPASQRDL